MFKAKTSFGSFSVDDLARARKFYVETLGLQVEEEGEMGLKLHLPGGGMVFVYPKGEKHLPAGFTVLNLVVEDIDVAVDVLVSKGVSLEKYEGFHQDKKGIARS